MTKQFFFIVSFSFCFTTFVSAQNPNLGTAGAQFLQIGIGAKPAALGGAYVAMANDALALFWNPAGIANIKNQSLHFSHTPWWTSVTLNSAAYALHMGAAGTLGAAVTVLAMDEMEVTTELQPDGTGQTFDAQNLMIGLTYARPLTDRFNAGITVKYVQERIWNETASGIAFDVGTQYHVGFRQLTIGMSLTNFGGDMRFDGRDLSYKFDTDPSLPRNRLAPAKLETESYPLPLHFQVGVAMEVMRTGPLACQVGVDVTHPNDNSERINLGTEVAAYNQVFLRGGYRYNYDDEDLTLGFGVALPFEQNKLTFDYAYSQYDLLPNVNRFSLSLNF